jgi:flagellar motor component MotA
MQQQLQMQQLESEVARLQVELRQVRQMIGSLIRHEQDTWQMAYPQHTNQGTQQQQQQLPTQFIQDEMRMAPQYQQMQSIGDRLDNQLQQISQSFQQDTTSSRGRMMNPTNNDPVQRQY